MLLLSNYSEHSLHLFSPAGKLAAQYQASGEGPEALLSHYLLGYSEEFLFFRSHRNRVVIFDKELNFIESYIEESLPFGRWMYFLKQVEPSTFLIALPVDDFLRKNHVATVVIKDNRLKMVSKSMAISEDAEIFLESQKSKRFYRVLTAHNGSLFFYVPTLKKEAREYEIFVIDTPKTNLEEAYSKVLSGSLTNFEKEEQKYRMTISRICKLKDGGFIVLLTDVLDSGALVHYWDFFDASGSFIRRRVADAGDFLIPVVNSGEILHIKEDGEDVGLWFYSQESP